MLLSSGQYLIYGSSLILEWLNSIRDELVAYMDAEDRNATGKSKASLQVVNVTATGGQLIGSDSIEFVFRGRAPGKMPPLYNIIQWCIAKGLPRQMAWVIAKRISEAGTALWRSGRNIIDEVVSEKKIQELVDSLTVIYTADIKSDIENMLTAKA